MRPSEAAPWMIALVQRATQAREEKFDGAVLATEAQM